MLHASCSLQAHPFPSRENEKNALRTFKHIATAWHTSSLKLWSKSHADKILSCLNRYIFSDDIAAMDIAKIETRHLAQLVQSIDSKGVHDGAGRVRQYLTIIMRYAVQQGFIKYNPGHAQV